MPGDNLLGEWLEQLGGRGRANLAHEEFADMDWLLPPELVGAEIADGSEMRAVGDSDVSVRLAATLEYSAFDPQTRAAVTRSGVINRRFDTSEAVAVHENFRLPRAVMGQGVGRSTLRRSAELYRRLGIESIRLTAVDTGKYVWGMAGFDFASEGDREAVFGAVLDLANDLLHDVPGSDLDLADAKYPWELGAIRGDVTPRELLNAQGVGVSRDIADNPQLDQPMRLGKALLLNCRIEGWSGVLDLDDESPCYSQLLRYTEDAWQS